MFARKNKMQVADVADNGDLKLFATEMNNLLSITSYKN